MKTITLLFSFMIAASLYAQTDEISVDRIEPPFWWTGMTNSSLQLLIYGNDIGSAVPEISYPGVKVVSVTPAENPNFLFIDLELGKNVSSGIFAIDFKKGGKVIISEKYELKDRKEDSEKRKGFTTGDVIYLLMPDRFANGDPSNDSHSGMLEKANRANLNGRHGGDIKGISNHLNYISDLGFTTLWINPLVENNNPEYSYHGYAITDFYKIDPRYGTNEDYVNLVSQAHNKNLKVVMDMVFNHCSIYHWFIEDLPFENWIHQFDEFTRSNFRASTIVDPHASDVDRDKMLTGWFDQHMADLDQRNGFLSDYLIQNTIWWIEYAGIDGIRVDTQPYSYKEFISDWAKAVFEEYPDFSIVGEAWLQEEAFTAYFQADADNPDGYNSHIPSVTDFPMRNVLNEAFNESNSWTGGLAKIYYVLAQDNIYPDAGNNLIFLDNHDLDRYYTSVKLDFRKWKMGVGALLTLRGIPSVYYGTELLMTGKEHDGHGHIRMDFPGGWVSDTRNAFEKAGRTEAEQKAYTYMKKLLNWRKTNEAVIKGTTKQFVPDGDTYVYFRCYPGKNVMVAMNNNENEMKALQTERFAECLEGYTWAENVITGEKVHYLDAITVAPKSILILELKK